MSKIKCLVVEYGNRFPYSVLITKEEQVYNEQDLAIHYMSNSAYRKYQEDESYLDEWIEKNVEYINILEPYELLDYLEEWGYL